MLGLVCLAWLYFRKLKLQRGGVLPGSPAQLYGDDTLPEETRGVASEPTSRFNASASRLSGHGRTYSC